MYHVGRQVLRGLRRRPAGAAATPAEPQRFCARGMASGGHGGHGVTYEGLTIHPPALWHKVVAEGMTGLLWFWVFVRAYHDGETFLFGHAHHFEAEGPDPPPGEHSAAHHDHEHKDEREPELATKEPKEDVS